jgi:hypothetical protein
MVKCRPFVRSLVLTPQNPCSMCGGCFDADCSCTPPPCAHHETVLLGGHADGCCFCLGRWRARHWKEEPFDSRELVSFNGCACACTGELLGRLRIDGDGGPLAAQVALGAEAVTDHMKLMADEQAVFLGHPVKVSSSVGQAFPFLFCRLNKKSAKLHPFNKSALRAGCGLQAC